MLAHPDRLEAGKPYPLGSTWDGVGVNFAVFSANAGKIELCVFDTTRRHEIKRYALPSQTNEIWHGYLPDAAPGLLYGYRAFGPYDPSKGHRFNPSKLLIDPYAKALAGDLRWTDALFGYRTGSRRADLSVDRRDSAGFVPKAVVVDDHFPWESDAWPETPWSETIIYEAHIRGMTRQLETAPEKARGTFRALAQQSVIDHLLRLGVTAIEIMPIHAFLQDRFLLERGLSNYWGYNTLAFFAVEPRYLCSGSPHEMRAMVRHYHAAGIEVILDVVYNHTCEGSELGPTLSWRGLDNASYYKLADDRRYPINDTGTGNTLNLTSPRVLQMVLDSLRYWAESFHVDGFRFDLGLTLGRENSGFDAHAGFFDALRQDPVLSRLKLITEPWDVGPGGYQLGHFPPGFAEWNDRYRDSVRKFWRGDGGLRGETAARLAGSGDIFDGKRRRPWASVNYVASHDGFTLHDLVSYEKKHNEANGEENRDGHSENYSSNYGAEGPTDNQNIIAYRERVKRSMLMSVFASLGTPMILMGDECGRTQLGNNNAYCQDIETSWFNWKSLETGNGAALAAFASGLARLRKEYGSLRSETCMSDRLVAPGVKEMAWLDERGVELAQSDWDNPLGRILILRRARRRSDGKIEITALMLNADSHSQHCKLPGPWPWRLLADSANPSIVEHDINTDTYELHDRAAALLAAILDAPT